MEHSSVLVATIERAAELTGSSVASIRRAKEIIREGIPELQDMEKPTEVFFDMKIMS